MPSIEDAALALVGTFSGRPFALRRDQLSPGSCGVSAAPTFNFSFWIEEEGVSVVVRDCATIVHLPELGVAVPADGELVFPLPSQDGESAPSVGHWTLKQDATATTPAIDIEFTASMLVNPESPAIPCVG